MSGKLDVAQCLTKAESIVKLLYKEYAHLSDDLKALVIVDTFDAE